MRNTAGSSWMRTSCSSEPVYDIVNLRQSTGSSSKVWLGLYCCCCWALRANIPSKPHLKTGQNQVTMYVGRTRGTPGCWSSVSIPQQAATQQGKLLTAAASGLIVLPDVCMFALHCDVSSHSDVIQQLLTSPIAWVHLSDNVTRLLKVTCKNPGRPVLPAATLHVHSSSKAPGVRKHKCKDSQVWSLLGYDQAMHVSLACGLNGL